MSGGRNSRSAVERAADLMETIRAQGPCVETWQLAALAGEIGLAGDQLVDALAFLEANGMITLRSIVEVAA